MSIYSKKHKFCFIHIEKNAGSSIRNTLSKAFKIPHFKSWNYFGPMRGRGGQTVKDYLKILGNEEYCNYFSFAIVRNPWDRLVSWYSYDNFGKSDFCSWLIEFFNKGEFDQLSYLKDFDDKIKIRFIGRFENLQSEFNQICLKLCIAPVALPRTNISKRGNYRDYYNDVTKNLVQDKLKKEIEMFNYTF